MDRTAAIEEQGLKVWNSEQILTHCLGVVRTQDPLKITEILPSLWSHTFNCQHCYHIRVSKSALPAHTIRSGRCSIREKWGFRVVNKFSFISLLIIFCWNRRLWPAVRVTGLRHLGKISSKIFSKSSAALLSRHF